MLFGNATACSHPHPGLRFRVQFDVAHSVRAPLRAGLSRHVLPRASQKGDVSELQSANGCKDGPLNGSTADIEQRKSSVSNANEAAGSINEPRAFEGSAVPSAKARPNAKKAAQHLSTFTKVAERAKSRANFRRSAEAASQAERSSPKIEEQDGTEPLKRSSSSSILADVVLSASSKARNAASIDIPDARSPQSLLSALKKKRTRPASLSRREKGILENLDDSIKQSPSKASKKPHLQPLTSSNAPSSGKASSPTSSSSCRWGQVSGVLATGGSAELAAVAGGATFVHKARERFMDVNGNTFWELIRSVVPATEWGRTASVLARLQSICRQELSQQADVAATALELVNTAKVLPPEDTVDSGSGINVLSSADIEDGSGAAPPLKPPVPGTTAIVSSPAISPEVSSKKQNGAGSGSSAGQGTSSRVSSTQANTAGGTSESSSSDPVAASIDAANEGAGGPVVLESNGGAAAGLQVNEEAGIALETVDLEEDNSAPISHPAFNGFESPSRAEGVTSSSQGAASAVNGSSSSSPGASRVDSSNPGSQARVSKDSVAAAEKTLAVLGSRQGQVWQSRAPLSHHSRVEEQLRWFTMRAHNGPLTYAESMSLDLLLMQQMMALASSAHFSGLKPRDVALANSLNEDKLSQLFVKVDKSTLDARLVTPHAHTDLPAEARSLLVLKRGTGIEANEGLLLVQKLDYLQLLVVEAVSEAAGRAWEGVVATGVRIARAGAGAGAVAAAEAARVAEETGVQYPSEPLVDTKAWGKLKGRGKHAIVAMREWGMSPRMIGGGLLLTLSDLGLGPKVDVIRLPRFDSVWPAPDKHPVCIRRVTLEDVFKRPAAASESLFRRLIKPAALEEPTFQELLVLYRRKMPEEPKWLGRYYDARIQWLRILDRVLDNGDRAQKALEERARLKHVAASRPPLQMRVLADIPMAYWKAVFPDKLMQFKPLDGLRLDFITVVGVVAALAQVKVDSPVLPVVSLASLVVAVVRSVLGYQRMSIRYENFTNEMIASKTLAQEDAVIEFLAGAAAQQRFASAALAFAALVRRKHRARTNIAAVAAAEAAALAAADDAAASAARRAAEPLRKQPWLARHMLQTDASNTEGAAESRSAEGPGSAALSALLDEGQRLLEAVRSVAGARSDRGKSGGKQKRRGSWQGPGMTASELRLEVETMLNEQGLGHVRFDVNSALHQLRRLQLLQTEDDAVRRWLKEAGITLGPHPEQKDESGADQPQKSLEERRTLASERRYVAVSSARAEQALTEYWTKLLEGSVATSLAGIL